MNEMDGKEGRDLREKGAGHAALLLIMSDLGIRRRAKGIDHSRKRSNGRIELIYRVDLQERNYYEERKGD